MQPYRTTKRSGLRFDFSKTWPAWDLTCVFRLRRAHCAKTQRQLLSKFPSRCTCGLSFRKTIQQYQIRSQVILVARQMEIQRMQALQEIFRRPFLKGQELNELVPQPRREWHIDTIDLKTLSRSRTDQLIIQEQIAFRNLQLPTPSRPHRRACMNIKDTTNALKGRTTTICEVADRLKLAR